MQPPDHLHINGRPPDQEFLLDHHLYRSFQLDDYDFSQDIIKIETLAFPDLSCNWSKYSFPQDVRYRNNGRTTDGCYSFSVEASRFNKVATPVHDPQDDPEFPNYSHVEVRALRKDDPPGFLPPKGRKLPRSPAKKLAYRTHICNMSTIKIMATG